MKICIVHGSPRKGNTFKAVEIFKKVMQKNGDIEFTEFFLPKDMPHFCCGCYTCFDKSEDKCPHAQAVQPIAQAMKEADGLIFSTPVYVLAESGAIKALLDHFGYIYIPHRPMSEMFSKVAMIISTTAGAGTRAAMKAIARSLRYWGIKRIYKCGFALMAKNWEDMKPEKQQRFESKFSKKAGKFYKMVEKRKALHPRIFTRFLFGLVKGMILKLPDGSPDKKYWKQKGWAEGKNIPFRQ